jgi:hypothetical protein
VGTCGATDRLIQSVRWVERGCRGDRPELSLTIGSTRLPLYLPYMMYLDLFLNPDVIVDHGGEETLKKESISKLYDELCKWVIFG